MLKTSVKREITEAIRERIFSEFRNIRRYNENKIS
jgi:hypothetical protein